MATIRRALTWKLLLAFTVPLVAGGLTAYLLIRDEMVEQFDSALEAQANAIAAVARIDATGQVDLEATARVMRDFDVPEAGEGDHEDDEAPPVFQIRRPDGTSVARSTSLGSAELAAPESVEAERHWWDLDLPAGVPGRAVAFRFRPESTSGRPGESTELVIIAAVDRRERDRTIHAVAWLLAGCGALMLGVTLLVVPHVVRSEFKPIDALADQAAHITADSLGSRFATASLPGELAPIGQRLNDLLARLETSFERERRFSGDLAHELRTPIAELRSIAEVAVKWPDARTADVDRDVLAIAGQMERIVTRLLAMLRSENAGSVVAPERVDLAALLAQLWQGLAPRGADQNLSVSWAVPAGLTVSADPVLLRSILINLLQNAVDYSPRGSAIAISAHGDDRSFEVRVGNDAGGLTEADVPRLFDRFWRRDTARTDAEHAGLGLPLARAFARASGGDVTAALDADGKLWVTLRVGSENAAHISGRRLNPV